MSNASWQISLRTTLSQLSKQAMPPRVAVVGIGHELGGDDAVGVRVAELLRAQLSTDYLLSIPAGPAPENFTGNLRRFRPALVLMVDAAQMNCSAGTVKWLDWRSTDGFSASTHTLPLNLFADYLTLELGCEVALIGIQPGQTYADGPLTAEVERVAQAVVKSLAESLVI